MYNIFAKFITSFVEKNYRLMHLYLKIVYLYLKIVFFKCTKNKNILFFCIYFHNFLGCIDIILYFYYSKYDIYFNLNINE